MCTPAEFFKITAVRETSNGSVILFQNRQVGVLVRLERGTVVGRLNDFMGEHYDAMSEMFRALLRAKLKFLVMDVCESTGNESTVDALGRLTVNSTNKNINKLMELQVGYIKTLVNDTIYSKDYLLIYTEASRVGTLIAEVEEALRMSMDGAIDGYEIMDQNGISAFVSEYFGVGYFSGEEYCVRVLYVRRSRLWALSTKTACVLHWVTLKGKSLKCKLRALRKASSGKASFFTKGFIGVGEYCGSSLGLSQTYTSWSGVLFNAVQEAPKNPLQNAILTSLGGINPNPVLIRRPSQGVSQPNQTPFDATTTLRRTLKAVIVSRVRAKSNQDMGQIVMKMMVVGR